MEEDNFINPVEEFRTESALQFFQDQAAGFFFHAAHLLDIFAADVAGHNQDAVAEVNRAALSVGQSSSVQDLQEDVEDVLVRFFNFVQEDYRIGPAPDYFGQLAAFLVTDVTGRRSD